MTSRKLVFRPQVPPNVNVAVVMPRLAAASARVAAGATGVVAANAGVYWVHDTFTDTDGVTIAAHTGEIGAEWAWWEVTSTADVTELLQITGFAIAKIAGGEFGFVTPSGLPEDADYFVETQAKWGSPDDDNFFQITIGARLKIDGAGFQQGYFLEVGFALGLGWRILVYRSNTADEETGGVDTTLASVTLPDIVPGAPHKMRLQVIGTNIKGFFDGVEQFSVTDTEFPEAGTTALLSWGSTGNLIDYYDVRPIGADL